MEFHTSLIGGQLGLLKTYHMIKKDFSRKVLKLMFRIFYLNVWFENKTMGDNQDSMSPTTTIYIKSTFVKSFNGFYYRFTQI
jgi:hypothetical protein